jgi:hypothetical protein
LVVIVVEHELAENTLTALLRLRSTCRGLLRLRFGGLVQGLAGRLIRHGFLTGRFLTGRFLTGGFLTGRFLTGRFLTGRFLTGRFLTGRFLTGRFLTGRFLTGGFHRLQYRTFVEFDCTKGFIQERRGILGRSHWGWGFLPACPPDGRFRDGRFHRTMRNFGRGFESLVWLW